MSKKYKYMGKDNYWNADRTAVIVPGQFVEEKLLDDKFYEEVNEHTIEYEILFESEWSWLDDKENLEENIQNYISRNNLEGKFRSDINKEDPLFYRALINRRLENLFPEPEPKKRKTKWSWMDDNENIEEDFYNYVLENNLEFKEIKLHDPSLYNAVKRRGLEDIALKSKVFTRAVLSRQINDYSKEELKLLQEFCYQRLSDIEDK